MQKEIDKIYYITVTVLVDCIYRHYSSIFLSIYIQTYFYIYIIYHIFILCYISMYVLHITIYTLPHCINYCQTYTHNICIYIHTCICLCIFLLMHTQYILYNALHINYCMSHENRNKDKTIISGIQSNSHADTHIKSAKRLYMYILLLYNVIHVLYTYLLHTFVYNRVYTP